MRNLMQELADTLPDGIATVTFSGGQKLKITRTVAKTLGLLPTPEELLEIVEVGINQFENPRGGNEAMSGEG